MKKEKVLNSNGKNLNDNEIKSVTGGINRQAFGDFQHIDSQSIEEVHMDPSKRYKFICKNSDCNCSFWQSGVGDNTLVRCPECGRNVR